MDGSWTLLPHALPDRVPLGLPKQSWTTWRQACYAWALLHLYIGPAIRPVRHAPFLSYFPPFSSFYMSLPVREAISVLRRTTRWWDVRLAHPKTIPPYVSWRISFGLIPNERLPMIFMPAVWDWLRLDPCSLYWAVVRFWPLCRASRVLTTSRLLSMYGWIFEILPLLLVWWVHNDRKCVYKANKINILYISHFDFYYLKNL